MVAVYARQSVDKKDSISIDMQLDMCKKEAAIVAPAEQIKIYKDKGFSGGNANRPSFIKMIADVEQGKISTIIVYKLDRFSRNMLDFINIYNTLALHNVNFHSVNEKFSTETPMGKAMMNILVIFAEVERENICERERDNYYERTKAGIWPGGPAPYGYRIVKDRVDGQRRIYLEETEDVPIIKKIFKEYAWTDKSLGQITKDLNEKNIYWNSANLSRKLRNPIYCMCDENIYAYYKKIGINLNNAIEDFDGHHAMHIIGKRQYSKNKKREYKGVSEQYGTLMIQNGCIDSKTFMRVQEKLKLNRQIDNSSTNSYLTGLMKCGNCGYTFSIQRYRDIRYLYCTGHTMYHVCDVIKSNFNLKEIEDAVTEEITKLIKEIECGGYVLKEIEDDRAYEEIDEIDRKISNLVEALADGNNVTCKYIDKKINELDKRKKEILNGALATKVNISKLRNIEFDKLTMEEQHDIACTLIAKVEILDDKIQLHWKI